MWCSSPAADTGKGVTKLGVRFKKDEDFGEWYSQVVVESEMISYYDVSGMHRTEFEREKPTVTFTVTEKTFFLLFF